MKSWKDRISEFLNSKTGLTLLFMGPIHFLLFLILLFPFLLEIYISFTSWEVIHGDWWLAVFNSGQNYLMLLTKDKRFYLSLLRTLFITVTAVSAEFGIGLFLASIFEREFKGKRFFISIYLIPMFVMPVIVGYDFYMILQQSGPINSILSTIAGTKIIIDWLVTANLSLLSIILTDIWHWTPFLFLILLSGLLALPKEPIEAADVLGASNFQIFKDIKLPMLRNVIIIAVVIRALEVMKLFDEIYIMTGGGPGSATETISLYTYIFSIVKARMAYGTSAAIIILILTLLICVYILRPVLTERWRR